MSVFENFRLIIKHSSAEIKEEVRVMIEKLSEKIGLTKTEIKVFIFLISVFCIGSIYSYFNAGKETDFNVFDYSSEEAIFDSLQNLNKNNLELESNNIDSNQEVLDFNKRIFEDKEEKKNSSSLTKINLNKANVKQLMTLPGVGEKTAQSIIDWRNKNGWFTSVNQLLEIKGIGQVKLEKIKQYIFIE